MGITNKEATMKQDKFLQETIYKIKGVLIYFRHLNIKEIRTLEETIEILEKLKSPD